MHVGPERVTARAAATRLRLHLGGAVQGVGFRPFVFRIARELGVAGWVSNDTAGAVVEAEADEPTLDDFVRRLREELPPHASILESRREWVRATGELEFRIRPSDGSGAPTALVLPDLATCEQCLREVHDRANRRFGYAFTNCTCCGPRFTIVRTLPYDRPNTSMAGFTLCPECRTEYEDPQDRRFHAQPNACAGCGPRLRFRDGSGHPQVNAGDDRQAVHAAAAAIGTGRIVAVKGIGGYLLVCDARDPRAVARLRARKRRPTKPFALMVRDTAMAARIAEVDQAAADLLRQSSAPIVLLPRRADADLAPNIAPGNPTVGVMLPCAPLLHLLLDAVGAAVVATSGNLGEEPICIEEAEALERLGGIADDFLTHDRPIERHVDDSVAWIVDGAPRLLRRARGYAPLPLRLPRPVPALLAVGAHLKNAVAVARGRDVFLSQHVGDLETYPAQRAFDRVIGDLLAFYDVHPVAIAHDLHPDYASTRWALAAAARGQPVARIPVQHHHAHLASCLAEHDASGSALGIVWDGAGLGTDGTVWGGEFLLGDAATYQRAASLRPFRLPGGDAAAREPDRIALALLYQLLGDRALELDLPCMQRQPAIHRRVLRQMIRTALNAPLASSMGRLLDGLAALLDLVTTVTFEGEAAMALEFAVDPAERDGYPLPLEATNTLDWRPLLHAVLEDLRAGVTQSRIAARVHNALIRAALEVAEHTAAARVALSGGCFQNRILTERLAAALRARGHEVLLHRMVPPNDGGIALGQIAVAAARLRGSEG